jgi:hypothetical protein
MIDSTIISVIGTGVGVIVAIYTILRNFKKDIKEELVEIKSEIKEIKMELRSIDQRVSRLEGAFVERGQCEGRLYSMQKNMTEKKQ